MITVDNSTEQAAHLIQVRAEWHADEARWVATNALTGEELAQGGTLAEIELQVSLWASHGDDSSFHCMPVRSQGRFLVH